jgi:hypothetical protein
MNPQIVFDRHKSFSYKIKEFLYYPYSLIKEVDEYIIRLDDNIISSFDIVIEEMKIQPFIKKFFRGIFYFI